MAAYTPITAGTPILHQIHPILHQIHPIPSLVVTVRKKIGRAKKSEVRVTRSGNVATVCTINGKNGTAVERAYYERSTDRAGPFFHRLN